ncbi:terminase family protein [Ignatzschineria rhizosphaerae]|uniref:Terminase family protein n=1 Tax=Ignatzschineria rhizosphaerae TaxID=2923279 RepID=A0ABY3X3A1_9GAMM|nr:terminase family protein [Ignatzschineria rhizosphaerae]UNM95497.1 terminase family protein [Ignatzschineria rhizosphaerae]
MAQITLPPLTIPEEDQARILYFAGWTLTDIATRLERPVSTVSAWKTNRKWDSATTFQRLQNGVETRYLMLIYKENKSNADYKELDQLKRHLQDLFFPKDEDAGGGKKKKKRTAKNISPEEFAEIINEAWEGAGFKYQKDFLKESAKHKISMLLKGRQTGLTWSLAIGRCLVRAVNLKHDQIYISASQKQAFQARDYIKRFVKEHTGIELSGVEDIELPNGAKIYFLATNFATAQGYSGDVTVDEYAWMLNFDLLTEVVKACATLKQYTIVMSSTPSMASHPSHNAWKGITESNKAGVKFTKKQTQKGILCEDHTYRKTITVEDAVAGGNELIDIDQLKQLFPDNYHFLYMAEWLKKSNSLFDAATIMRNMVPAFSEWFDYNEHLKRPYEDRPVILGYDPALKKDASAVVVIALPTPEYPFYRVLEKYNFFGNKFEEQAKEIKKLTERFNVVHIGIDTTAIGAAVYPLVKAFFHNTTGKQGTSQLKYLLVTQMQGLFRQNRVKFPIDWTDLFECFMAISLATTRADSVVIETSRSQANAHGDYAWSTMYGIGFYEDITGETHQQEGRGGVL